LDLVAWTSNSSTVVTYSSSARVLRWFDISMQSPVPGSQVDLSYLEGDVAALATNSDGGQTVIGVKHPTRGGFYALVDGAPAWQLSATSDPGNLLFANSGNVLYAIDRNSRRVARFPDGVKGGYEILSFSGESAPLADPVGLALSTDGQRLYMAGGIDHIIRAYDLQSRRSIGEISLSVKPSGLLPLGEAGPVLILGPQSNSHDPLWLLDLHSVPSVFFVPAASEIRQRIIWSGE
jgi:hypothetical protein